MTSPSLPSLKMIREEWKNSLTSRQGIQCGYLIRRDPPSRQHHLFVHFFVFFFFPSYLSVVCVRERERQCVLKWSLTNNNNKNRNIFLYHPSGRVPNLPLRGVHESRSQKKLLSNHTKQHFLGADRLMMFGRFFFFILKIKN